MNLKHTLVATAVHQSVQPPAPDPDTTSIRTEGERVVVRFPRPVIWLGLSGDEAIELGKILVHQGFALLNASKGPGDDNPPQPVALSPTGEQPYVPNT